MISVSRRADSACQSCGAKPCLAIEIGPSATHKVEVRLCSECFQRCVDLKEGTVTLDSFLQDVGETREVRHGGGME